jgi:hypothetical protein
MKADEESGRVGRAYCNDPSRPDRDTVHHSSAAGDGRLKKMTDWSAPRAKMFTRSARNCIGLYP